MEKKSSIIGKVIGIVFAIAFIAAVIAMIYFFNVNPPVGVFLLGCVFLAMGILAIATEGIRLKEAWILLFPLVGFGCMAVSASYIWSFSFFWNIRLERDTIIVLLVLLLFFVVGLWMIVKDLLTEKKKKLIYTYEVQAKCIDVKESCDGEGSREYIPVFQYLYNETEYVHTAYWAYHKGAPCVNQYYTLMLNPENPAEAWFPNRPLKRFWFLMAGIFMVVPLIVAYKMLWG